MLNNTMLIAQISDLHLRTDGKLLKDKVDSVAALEAAINHLNALDPQPDVVLATGDLVNKADKQDFQALRAGFDRIQAPVLVIPGNHDDRTLMRETFGDQGYFQDEKFLHYTVEDYPIRLIGLDTVKEGSDGGELCGSRRGWIDSRLREQPECPTFIFMHHPPFGTGIGFMDKLDFYGASQFAEIISRHPHVVHITCGHMHRPMTVAYSGTAASVAPSLVFQMALDLKPDAPSGFVLEPPGLKLYTWVPGTGLVGHVGVIGDYGPKHPFVPD